MSPKSAQRFWENDMHRNKALKREEQSEGLRRALERCTREALIFPHESAKPARPSKKSHLTLAMAEQDAITPLASGANQGPAVLFLKGAIGSRLAQVAQLVEQRIENPRVTGSIPVLGTIQSLKASLICLVSE